MGNELKYIPTIRRFKTSLFSAVFIFMFLVSYELAAVEGWQGTQYPNATQASKPSKSRFLILNTGGSGGGFGKGDIRQNLLDISFWNSSLGWVCGYGGVFRSTDGGLTWKRMLQKGGWYQLEMVGPEDVWLLEGIHPGGIGKVWLRHSTDGGQSWREELAGKLNGYRDMYCRGAQRWVLTGTAAWNSADGGITWRQVNFPVSGGFQPIRISIPADMMTGKGFVVYVIGNDIKSKQICILKSEDMGLTWRRLEGFPPVPATHRLSLFFASSQSGWVGGELGQVWHTGDGGKSWKNCPLPSDQFVCALWFEQLGRGFASVNNNAVGKSGAALFETRNGGNSWEEVLNGNKQINRIYSINPQALWIVGDVPGYVPNDLVGILQPF